MGNSTFWIIIFSFCIVGYFFDKFLRKKLNMPKSGFWGYKHVNSLHVKLEIGLFIIYLVTSFIYIYKFENANIGYAIITYLGVTWILRSWMEWKYDRESKEYIFSIIGLVSFIVMFLILFYFDPFSA
ncbi:DUF4181 domain-containing protein [Bacillus nitratireducens]|uniref:DUF4181 domain-containing protein n=1 Tax=Bacillus nitratireducens TaxID=2026193 RepID=UPI000A27CC50|nr:DUF4181 domain-containing protein [Bacillus nitratireducens]OSX98499.1 hypothetical protein BTJ45_04515 [Bacillus mycoides]PDY21088.1 DUF4181 domain-containing protein [Bacillus cereus]PFJ50909.1 DUF4181 domain-containing protein [Bacillus cereus]PFW09169.1 DUF4181 domain-containing protein [Bacillus cereus]PGW97193.1 DUF4181 domain-containing protein [Bacillus cereus]